MVATAATALAVGACGAAEGPQAGVAPRGASGADAGVTNGAISYTARDLASMMAESPSEAARLNAATRAAQAMVGEPTPPPPKLDPRATPDYFGGTANWANSPTLRKFVDSLPGVGEAAANDLGQYIPVAVPDTTTYPGSDYYEIAVRQFSERLHRDLPRTQLRGYVQLNNGTDAGGRNTVVPAAIHYLGPLIEAQRGRPVRIKFVNQLPAGEAGKLFLPVDTTITGAGAGPLGGDEVYPQNRASLYLHGGLTPWISGGTQYQWVTPAGERSPYGSGPSLTSVPDMWFDARGRPVEEGTPGATNDPGPGATTLYFPNDQSARFLYLHDDTYGLTRLSVYAGEAAPYFIADPAGDELVAGNAGEPASSRAIDAPVEAGTVPAAELPLLIEDKTFVPGAEQLRAQDPTWDVAAWGGLGALWYPHVYMPNQNGIDVKGATDNADLNAKGRWDYLPWYWTGYKGTVNGPVANPLYGTAAYEPKQNPGTPNPSVVPNAFHDTMLVNGTAYPYVKVARKAYRLRILNACGDRSLNLQLYRAKSDQITETGPGGVPELQAESGDVPMLPAVGSLSGGQPVGWPTDGRAGGVPDPRAAGPDMIQIGNDGGLLPQVALLPATPVGFTVKPPTEKDSLMGVGIAIVGISGKALFLGPGERADVIVDFSGVPSGSKLILYNDAPAPAPSGDSRVDYYTGDPDLSAIGGAPSTVAGYGPNTRTILQFQVEGAASPAFDLERLRLALPAAYAASQDPVLVPTAAYDAAYGTESSPEVPLQEDGTVTFAPLGRGYELTLPAQGKIVADLFDPDVRPQDGHPGRGGAALGQRHPHVGAVLRHRPRHGVRPGRRPGGRASRRRRDAAVAHHARRHRVAQHPLRRDGRPGARARAARRRGARARPRRAGLEGHAARRPARVLPHRHTPGAPAAVVQARRRRAPARRHAPAGCDRRVHRARPGHRCSSDRRQRTGGLQLGGVLGHPPAGRRGEPHGPAAGDPGQPRGARGADGDRGRRPRGHSHVDGADLPAAGRRLRSGTRRRRELPHGPHILRGGRRRRVPHRRLGAGRPHLLLPGAGRRRDGVLALVGAGRGGRAVADGRDRRADRHTAERSSPDEEVPIRR